jgi:glycosyltransferase involved in cell wall biosynthesis
MGGPAHVVGLLSGRRLDPEAFDVRLVHGALAPGEDSMAYVAEEEGARLHFLPDLGQPVDPRRDAGALRALVGIMRSFRPHVVHTHTAKAGFLGRLAAIATRPRPALVHTYHGHVLDGYFGPAKTRLYRGLERSMARVTDRLVGVSRATVEDLLRIRIGSPKQYRVIRIGLDLEPFTRTDRAAGSGLRRDLAISDGDVVVTYAGRLAPIKRVDMLLRAVGRARADGRPLHALIVGDGELRPSLEALAGELGIPGSVSFVGYQRELVPIAAATDLAAVASENEGTPVSLIEAGAAARPAVATAVGGVAEVVTPDSGVLVRSGDEEAFAGALAGLASDPQLRASMGARAREHVVPRFSASRLLADTRDLYEEVVRERFG